MSSFPQTRRTDVVEERFGHRIADPYRWLEEPDDPEVVDWVRRQADATEAAMSALPERPWFAATMDAVVHRPRAGVPFRRAGHYVVTRNDGSQQQDVWFVAESLAELRAGGRVLVDPNLLSADGTASVEAVTFSPDGRFAAYGVSEGGSDWQTFQVVEVADSRPVPDAAIQTKFSVARWLPDGTSYLYLDYPHRGTASGTETAALASGRLALHRIGDDHDADEVVLEISDRPRVFIDVRVSDDGRFAAVSIAEGSATENRLWVYPISTADGRSRLGEPMIISDEPVAELSLIDVVGSSMYLQTDLDAPRGRVVSVDLEELARTGSPAFRSVIPESDATLDAVVTAGDRLVVAALVDARPQVVSYAVDGTDPQPLDVPGGALVGLDGHWGDPEVLVGMSSVTDPTVAFRVDSSSVTITRLDDLVPPPTSSPDRHDASAPPAVISERRTATSKDGTAIPYTTFRAAGVDAAAPRPALLWAYGGFKIPVLADYRAGWPAWLAAGGVLVIANLRGGGEYGSAWHDAGRLRAKQNVFDDCIAVAEDLITTGVTSADQLALHGRSNGGLLVGAVLTQRPDLLAAALPAVGVLDMLRFHLFTIGKAWTCDYGDPDVAEDFRVLLDYSPLHRIRPGTAYPPTLIMTGDHDDRVVPLHSHKFAATLQQAQTGPAPILARIETAAGHGSGKSASMVAAEWADLLAFAAHHTGLPIPPAG